MSSRTGNARRKQADPRIERTRALLHEALGSLIREKSYDRITVADILARARVSRSTFYIHFRDKDDLLMSGMHALLVGLLATAGEATAGPVARATAFGLPLFTHIHGHRRSARVKLGVRGRAILHQHLRRVLAEWIMRTMEEDRPPRKPGRRAVAPELLAQHVASTFVLVLHWWLDHGDGGSPAEANELFQALVTPVLEGARL
jgi:AcrR family transcriptional regulator